MDSGSLWALVLAAGSGSRLRSLTTTADGVQVPKQFCSLRGGSSLLQDALTRAGTVASRHHRVTVVAEDHRRWWDRATQSIPPENVIVQPENRGTAAGLLLPLMHIVQRDPAATVLVLPADHFFLDEAMLAQQLRSACRIAGQDREFVHLLGIEPLGPDPELGYIVPAVRCGAAAGGVRRFVEKPPVAVAGELIAAGALLNMFILVSAASALLALFAARQPDLVGELRSAALRDRCSPREPLAARRAYRLLPTLDFSRDILVGQAARLRLLRVPACGWSDRREPLDGLAAVRRLRQNTPPK